MRKRRGAAAVAVALLVASLGTPALEVRRVRVESRGGPLDESLVRSLTAVKPGDTLSRAALTRDVRNLEQSGRFSFVRVLLERVPGGVEVVYQVEPRPRLRSLRVVGADNLGNKKVSELLALHVGDAVDDAVLAVRAQKVLNAYRRQWFPYAKVRWNIRTDPASGEADVEVTVREGRRAGVRRIRFEGAQRVSPRALRGAMKQRTAHPFSWLTGAGRYDPDALAGDVLALREVYLGRGHLDAQIGEPQVRELTPRSLEITIPVREGPRYEVGRVAVEGVAKFSGEEVQRQVSLRSGQVASQKEIDRAAQAIRDFYGSRGYIRTAVRPVLQTDPGRGVADVTFQVKEGSLAHIRDIRLRGNSRTKDKVLRRELAVHPGEIFNEVKVRTSEQRLRNLGYFSTVASRAEETPEPGWYDLVIEVEEQKTGQLVAGAGFSSIDDLVGYVELSQGNFDLFGWPHFTGGGQKLRLRTQFGRRRTDYELSFVEPWLLDRRLALGVNLFRHDRRFLSDEYDQRNTGAGLSLSRGFGRFYRGTVEYSLEEIEVYNVAETASFLIREEEGRRTKSAATLSWVRDTRDSVFVPTRGNRTRLAVTLAGGPLGAETELYLLEARSSQFFPLWLGHVLNLRGWAAVVEAYGGTERVPIFDRLFLGGARTIRGFRYRDVGPKVATSRYRHRIPPGQEQTQDEDEPIGGQTAAYATAEYTIPLGKNFRFATFYDTGMVWEDPYEWSSELNSSWGVGLRVDIPGFPVQLDYAWPIETDEYNDQPSGRLSFSVGYVF